MVEGSEGGLREVSTTMSITMSKFLIGVKSPWNLVHLRINQLFAYEFRLVVDSKMTEIKDAMCR